MVTTARKQRKGPARLASALLALVYGAALHGAPAAAQAPAARPAQPQQAVPDTLLVSKLIWSTMAAIDHADITGNYSVLRDLGSPGFQANNNAATLAGVFQAIRNSRVDLSNTLLLAPTLEFPPTIVQGGLLRLRGVFGLRPTGAAFDLLFENIGGNWRLFGVSVVPFQMGNVQNAPIRR